MTIFVLNMVSVSMVVMAAVCLIILRERTDTQLLMAAVCLEAIIALGSLLWIQPGELDNHFLAVRMFGRFIESSVMWTVIIMQVRGIQRTLLNPAIAEVVTREIDDLKAQIVELKKHEGLMPEEDDPNAPTH